jgi:hypothetical protein
MMRSFRIQPHLQIAIAIFVLGTSLWSCQTTGSSYAGKPARPENQISVSNGPKGTGTWYGKHIAIGYRWQRSGDQLDLECEVDFELGRSQRLRYFFLGVSFVDSEGIVISSERLLTTGGIGRRKVPASKRFILPPQTQAIAFFYKGEIFIPQTGTRGLVSAP